MKKLLLLCFTLNMLVVSASPISFAALSTKTSLSATATFTLTTTDVSCNGGSNGTATVNVNTGIPPYTYNWGPTITSATNTVSSLSAGNYGVTVTDNSGTPISQLFSISEPFSIITMLNISDETAAGNDGSISASVSGGIAPYTYNWGSGSTTSATINGLSSGNYCVTISDANSCTEVQCGTVNQAQPSQVANLVITEIMYNAPESGTDTSEFIEFFNAGSTPVDLSGYTFNEGVNHTFSSHIIQPNQYFTIAYDSNAFRNTYGISADFQWSSGGLSNGGEDISLHDNLGRTVDSVDYDNSSPWPSGSNQGQVYGGGASLVLCNLTSDNNDGTNWSAATNAITGKIVNGKQVFASPGMANSCATPLSISISSTPETCSPGCDGSITTAVTGGTSPYTYLWSNGAAGANLINLCSGTYSVTVSDALGNSTASVASVNAPNPILISSTSTNVSTIGGSDGTISLNVSGGISPYSFIWSDAFTLQNRTNLSTGTYCVTVTDANSCSEVDCTTILGPSSLILNPTVVDVLCHGDSTGSISLSTSGGTMPYTYNWSNGASTASISNLKIGNYAVTVTDAVQTDSIMSFMINQPTAINITLQQTSVSCGACNDGAINAQVSGGSSPYSYVWSNGVFGQNPISNLSAGFYCVTVTDANGCTEASCDTVLAPGQLANIIITEIMYNPPESGTDSLEYIELVNAGTSSVQLNGYAFADGIDYTFGSTSLLAGEFYVIAVDTSAFRNVFGYPANMQWTSGGLSNGGEDIVLKDNFGRTVDSVDYDNGAPWPMGSGVGSPSGGGASIELIDSINDNNLGANWRSSSTVVFGVMVNGIQLFGSPGFSNISVGIADFKDTHSQLTFYPNPSNGHINISNSSNDYIALEIHNITGKKVFTKRIKPGLVNLDLSHFNSGIYFLKYKEGVKKLIITK